MVFESPNGQVVGIEVKASSMVSVKDFNSIRSFSAAIGASFCREIVIYTGDHLVPFGERMLAIPIQALWSIEREKV